MVWRIVLLEPMWTIMPKPAPRSATIDSHWCGDSPKPTSEIPKRATHTKITWPSPATVVRPAR
jgi:hypothetical protein